MPEAGTGTGVTGPERARRGGTERGGAFSSFSAAPRRHGGGYRVPWGGAGRAEPGAARSDEEEEAAAPHGARWFTAIFIKTTYVCKWIWHWLHQFFTKSAIKIQRGIYPYTKKAFKIVWLSTSTRVAEIHSYLSNSTKRPQSFSYSTPFGCPMLSFTIFFFL